ncbi:hypothetical protein PO124_23870 [Bacillus licheniformis]|nr:hypothetical protein [Bacillus licheniformis]
MTARGMERMRFIRGARRGTAGALGRVRLYPDQPQEKRCRRSMF